jgi:hypothetical protein
MLVLLEKLVNGERREGYLTDVKEMESSYLDTQRP